MLFKTGVFKDFSNFTGKHLQASTFLKKAPLQVFSHISTEHIPYEVFLKSLNPSFNL